MSEAPKKPDDMLDLVHIDHIIAGANSHFFSDLAKLLKTAYPMSMEEKNELSKEEAKKYKEPRYYPAEG